MKSEAGKGDDRRPRRISYAMEDLRWKLLGADKEDKESIMAEIRNLEDKEAKERGN